MNSFALSAPILLIFLLSFVVESRNSLLQNATQGTRRVVLFTGSLGYDYYRHQSDVCHAYQILKKGGLKDENIIVFMSDDIAFNMHNPGPGIITNKPYDPDVHNGVPKVYTNENCTANNFLAALLGNKTGLSGCSGKVVNSGPNDYIFVYYADYCSPSMVAMLSGGGLYAKDLTEVLRKKHEAT